MHERSLRMLEMYGEEADFSDFDLRVENNDMAWANRDPAKDESGQEQSRSVFSSLFHR